MHWINKSLRRNRRTLSLSSKSKLREQLSGKQRRNEIRRQTHCIVLNLCYQRASQQKNKLTRRVRRPLPLTQKSRKQIKNSTSRGPRSVPSPPSNPPTPPPSHP